MADDDDSAASVSTLRSRFEQLATSKPAAGSSLDADTSAPTTPHFVPLRPSHTGVDPFRESSRLNVTSARGGPDHAGFTSDQESSPRHVDIQRSSTLPRGYGGGSSRQRPLSVYSTFSPPKSPPSFKFETPKSPQKQHLTLDKVPDRTPISTGLCTPALNSRMPKRDTSPNLGSGRNGRTPPPVPSARPTRPVSMMNPPSYRDPQPQAAREAPEYHYSAADRPQNAALPPPVPERTNKPKLGNKPPIPPKYTRPTQELTAQGTHSLAPAQRSDDRISPFNTPPASANNSPTRADMDPPVPQRMPKKLVLPPSSFPPPPHHSATHERRESRSHVHGMERRERYEDQAPRSAVLPPPGPEEHFSKNAVLPPPPRQSIDGIRPRMKVEDSVRGQRMSVDESGRPDLPPRPPGGGLIGGIKARMPHGRSRSPPVAPSRPERREFLPPPQRALASRSKSPQSEAGIPEYDRAGNDDSDDGAVDDQSGLSDYPDSSQANRRKPFFQDGPSEIPCKSDVKMFAVCGRYVCTISHSTKVWDIDTGRCIMAMQHGEGIRVTALAFKPSARVEDEGTKLWLGTAHGDLMEVDIATQKITDTRTSAHAKKEVTKIHRQGFELWTLDSDGKLQVWGPDMHGAPNLRNSPVTFRIHAKTSCSIVVDGYLWVGTGKSVEVYRPTTDTTRTFSVTNRPLQSTKQTGEITCAAIVNSQPDKVYFGHSDGKVSIYSRKSFTFLEVVSVSLYKINSMTGVGDYLWAGFKTGMMYVYDLRHKPWQAKKDWQCSAGPILNVVADRTSIWKNGRLQVVSLGTDNIIRIWDGMLQEDWLEGQMQKRDTEFCSFQEIEALIVTWNAGATKPQDVMGREGDRKFFQKVLGSVQSPDIIVFGFQELVDLEDKKLTAKTFLKGGKKKRAADHQERMSHQYRLWQQHLQRTVDMYMPEEEPYYLMHVANMVGLFTCIFVKQSLKSRITDIAASSVKRGLGGLHGNKGALVIRLVIDDSSLCFINCHLAAGQSHTISRNNDIAAILESTTLPPDASASSRTDKFVGGGDGSMILDHEICILNGDLNYRIDASRETCIHKVKQNDLQGLLEKDQLLTERRKNPGFRLRVFNESALTFAPTYKYDVGTDEYDTSEKKRSPAWCDRILYRGIGKIKQTDYRRWEVRASDHRPVSGNFLIRLKTVDPKLKKKTWKSCMQRYEQVRAKHVFDAKLDYLVNVCGYPEDMALKSLNREDQISDAVALLEGQS